jgi:hypothetical protein
MTLDFLLQVKSYIEKTEEIIDGEWGNCRSHSKLLLDDKMPSLYHETLSKLGELGFIFIPNAYETNDYF